MNQVEDTLSMAPLLMSRFAHIDTVKPLNDSDGPCLAEIRDVLRKHGRLDRFGVALLHSHFPVGPDEVMVEETDEAQRVQVITPMKLGTLGVNDVGTIWSLEDGGLTEMARCRRVCKTNILSEHKGYQQHVR
ncbi:MAG: hypothetical protein Athens041674_523 [Parcubacteria group bacterium Athens0416_74]|nr:MAG: hypothetical protein Athens041674_523 [Parcubacteria group bacterium Athens0416_74]